MQPNMLLLSMCMQPYGQPGVNDIHKQPLPPLPGQYMLQYSCYLRHQCTLNATCAQSVVLKVSSLVT